MKEFAIIVSIRGDEIFTARGRLKLLSVWLQEKDMDKDLDGMTREELTAEVKKLRQGIRQHRDGIGHDLCWHHPWLWSLLPEKTDPLPVVPDWPQFNAGLRQVSSVARSEST